MTTKTKQELREALRLAAAAAEQAKDRDAVLNDAERAARRAYYAVIEAEIAAEKREPTTHRFADESGFGGTESSISPKNRLTSKP